VGTLGDNWVPILDNRFEWVNTGTDRSCLREEGTGWHAQTSTHQVYPWMNGAYCCAGLISGSNMTGGEGVCNTFTCGSTGVEKCPACESEAEKEESGSGEWASSSHKREKENSDEENSDSPVEEEE